MQSTTDRRWLLRPSLFPVAVIGFRTRHPLFTLYGLAIGSPLLPADKFLWLRLIFPLRYNIHRFRRLTRKGA